MCVVVSFSNLHKEQIEDLILPNLKIYIENYIETFDMQHLRQCFMGKHRCFPNLVLLSETFFHNSIAKQVFWKQLHNSLLLYLLKELIWVLLIRWWSWTLRLFGLLSSFEKDSFQYFCIAFTTWIQKKLSILMCALNQIN